MISDLLFEYQMQIVSNSLSLLRQQIDKNQLTKRINLTQWK